MAFYYTYVLKCADEKWYIGSTDDLDRRLGQHRQGRVPSTKSRLPFELVYFEGCRSLSEARRREKQLKTGYGRAYLSRRLGFEQQPSR